MRYCIWITYLDNGEIDNCIESRVWFLEDWYLIVLPYSTRSNHHISRFTRIYENLTPTIIDRYTCIVFCMCSRFSFICKRNSPNTDETLSWSMSEKCARNILQSVKNVLLRRFRNFARNHVRFKGTERPTMKLLALSAEIPSPENLYIPPPVPGMKCCSTILDIIRKKKSELWIWSSFSFVRLRNLVINLWVVTLFLAVYRGYFIFSCTFLTFTLIRNWYGYFIT